MPRKDQKNTVEATAYEERRCSAVLPRCCRAAGCRGPSAHELGIAEARVFRAGGCGVSSLKTFVNVKSACDGTQASIAPPTMAGYGAHVTAVVSLWSICGGQGSGYGDVAVAECMHCV